MFNKILVLAVLCSLGYAKTDGPKEPGWTRHFTFLDNDTSTCLTLEKIKSLIGPNLTSYEGHCDNYRCVITKVPLKKAYLTNQKDGADHKPHPMETIIKLTIAVITMATITTWVATCICWSATICYRCVNH